MTDDALAILRRLPVQFVKRGVGLTGADYYLLAPDELKAIISALEARDAQIKAMAQALQEISKGEGRFSRDPLEHCTNTVEDMKGIAKRALSPDLAALVQRAKLVEDVVAAVKRWYRQSIVLRQKNSTAEQKLIFAYEALAAHDKAAEGGGT